MASLIPQASIIIQLCLALCLSDKCLHDRYKLCKPHRPQTQQN